MIRFDTQVCTTREQSERLLALGLNKETADCFIWCSDGKDYVALNSPDSLVEEGVGDIYAWSLHRLIGLCPKKICLDDYDDTFYFLTIDPYMVTYEREDMDILKRCERGNVYDRMVDMIGWLVRKKHFNKEYLEENE